MNCDEAGGNLQKLNFRFITVGDQSTFKIIRATRNLSEPFRKIAPGAGFGNGYLLVLLLQHAPHDFFERFLLFGINLIAEDGPNLGTHADHLI